jgi:acetyl/propionyl-CoA carboxylase alpha subunit
MKMEWDHKGEKTVAEVEKIKGQLWVHLHGRTFVYEPEGKNNSSSGKKSKIKHGDIMAPMPGKITKIQKQKGNTVQVGDVVVVMEAMKMEYTLKAEKSGTIEDICCQVGEQVTLGKMLAKIK